MIACPVLIRRCSRNCARIGTASTLQLAPEPATDRFCRCVCAWGGQHQRLSRRVRRHLDSGGLPTGRSHPGAAVHRIRRHFLPHLPQRMLQVGHIRILQHARYWGGGGAFNANLRFERIRCARLERSSAGDAVELCRGAKLSAGPHASAVCCRLDQPPTGSRRAFRCVAHVASCCRACKRHCRTEQRGEHQRADDTRADDTRADDRGADRRVG